MKTIRYYLLTIFVLGLGYSCSDNSSDDSSTVSGTDITNAIFTGTSGSCANYTGSFSSSVTDVKNSKSFTGSVTVADNGNGTCTITSNSIPNHDFNDSTASFATNVAEVSATYTLSSSPSNASSTTSLTLSYDNAVFLNGAKLDLLPAACYGVGTEPLGQEKIGCTDDTKPWRYDPMYSGNDFGTDAHNAHTQPDGAYHYHGNPLAMFTQGGSAASAVIGFAADGYPIFGPYINDNGTIREVVSGYTLKSGSRVSQSGEGAFPGGSYDGTFRDDYEYTNAGDLDECNGMTKNGVYGYYVTNSFPWVLNCFKGTPNSTFSKSSGKTR